MALDRQIERLLRSPLLDGDVGARESIEDLRRGFEAVVEWQGDREPVARARALELSRPGGPPLPLRVYEPADPGGLLLVFLHGGAWRLGSLEIVDRPCRRIANAAGCTVASVGYRLAPEHPFPAALDDAMLALRWAAEHASDHGASSRRLVIGGESAGGNLAAAAALRSRDEGAPALAGQLLVYPSTDHDLERPSYDGNDGLLLTRDSMRDAWDDYLPDGGGARDAPYVSPLRAPTLAGLPPATVLTCEYDPLRDEGEAYALRLLQAGVPLRAQRFNGLCHGVLYMGAIVDRSAEVFDAVAAALREVAPLA